MAARSSVRMARNGGAGSLRRWRLLVGGTVQGVGFRPYVYRLACRFALTGRVYNDAAGVVIEAEGPEESLTAFTAALVAEPPPAAEITAVSRWELTPAGTTAFIIESSETGGPPLAGVAPDLAICPDCLRELFDPADRRYLYPFINCTNCGPRYTISERIPYDRPNTSMRAFTMCPACQAEYQDPADRRFHAQPNACPLCGPRLRLLNFYGPLNRQVGSPGDRSEDFRPRTESGGAADGWAVDPAGGTGGEDPAGSVIALVRDLLRAGKVVAIKGIGGFHLAVDAANGEAVRTLRRRKGREQKPLALMVRDLATARQIAHLTPAEEMILLSPARPILLAGKKPGHNLASEVAFGNSRFGVMLPYAPLHHLLFAPELPVLVMTSANHSGEPLCIADEEARRRLVGIADAILLHDREIVRGNDDSVLMVIADDEESAPEGTTPVVPTPLFLRRGRGHTPGILPPVTAGPPLLGVGAELKSSVCLADANRAVLSQHLGDLRSPASYALFRRTIADLAQLFAIRPQIVACDLHPDYLSSRWARQWAAEQEAPLVTVQHHHAHLAACLAEQRWQGPAIGLILDGSGYGTDGTVWGGELLLGDCSSFTRFGHLETMPLPGGDAVVSEPWRAGFAYLERAFAGKIPDLPFLEASAAGAEEEYRRQQELVRIMLRKNLHCPATSSCGRLFDAVAAICGVCRRIDYEAQAAIELMQLGGGLAPPAFDYAIEERGEGIIVAVSPLVRDIARAVAAGEAPGRISRRFHYTLVRMFSAAVRKAARVSGLKTVVLSGGVMQNELFYRGLRQTLAAAGFTVLTPQRLPPNDGGIAYGQAAVAGAKN